MSVPSVHDRYHDAIWLHQTTDELLQFLEMSDLKDSTLHGEYDDIWQALLDQMPSTLHDVVILLHEVVRHLEATHRPADTT